MGQGVWERFQHVWGQLAGHFAGLETMPQLGPPSPGSAVGIVAVCLLPFLPFPPFGAWPQLDRQFPLCGARCGGISIFTDLVRNERLQHGARRASERSELPGAAAVTVNSLGLPHPTLG